MGESEYKFCTQCGAKMPVDARFCTSCGAEFDFENVAVNGSTAQADTDLSEKAVKDDGIISNENSINTGSVYDSNVSDVNSENNVGSSIGNNKGIRKKNLPIIGGIAVIVCILIAAAFFFNSSIKYDADLVGDGEIYNSVDGLEELDSGTTGKIVKAINKKYGADALKYADMSVSGEMSITASDEASGMSLSMGGNFDGGISLDLESQMYSVVGSGNVEFFGMKFPLEMNIYGDNKNGTQYSNMLILGEESGWTKDDIEADSENEDFYISIDRDLILNSYRDEDTGAYVLELDLTSDDIEKSIENTASGLEESTGEDFDFSKVKAYLTLDEGLGVVGLYADLSGCMAEEEDYEIGSFYVKIRANSFNKALTITIPAEALSAENASDQNDSLYDEFVSKSDDATTNETGYTTSDAEEQIDANLPQIEIADIFVSSDEAVSWSMSYDGGTYYMIPVGDDGNTIFFNSDNELAGYAEVYYMDAESIEQTENGGLKVTGTMYTNTSEPVYNGVFSVTWDSMEMIDWPYVEAVNGTEMTDVSMTGEYGYYGFIDSNADVYNTEAGGIYDVSLEYIFPDSNSRYLTEADVAGMDAATIRLGINEIYARHGRAFQTEDLNAYFSSKSWYTPMYSADEFAAMEDAVFNEYEKANITFLGGVRDRLNG